MFCTTFIQNRKEIQLQQLPLELILPEVWIHVFCKHFRCSWRSNYRKTGSWTFNNRKVIRFSAKSLIVESKFLQILFAYARNRSGPNILPWDTPGVTLTSSDNHIPVHNQTWTHCKFSFRLQHIQWLYMNINRIYTDFFHCLILNTIHYILEAASMDDAVSFRNVEYCAE